MKRFKKIVSLATAVTLCVSSLSLDGFTATAYAADIAVDTTVKLKPTKASTFNDTNGDGLGEFEGWGTSLCWWANRIGYSESLTEQAGRLFFGDEGLDMNIGRYNVGGGDHTGETTQVPVNDKAVFYDLETEGAMPTYGGNNMAVSTVTAMENVTYSASDADFGITKGTKVGSFLAIGWINKLDDAVGSGDNLRYTVNAAEAGNYTVKLLLTLSGSNKRDVAIRVNENTEFSADYIVDAATINANTIASGNNNMLFVATIPNVALNAGENTINIAGKSDWTLDFVKMAVIKSGEEGILPGADEFLHPEHIIRSDSGVPGYCTDVTKIDTNAHDFSWYEENFVRADAECGYAWNYDWNADNNQINVLKAAMQNSGEEFHPEAFSNSPPYFMTESGCSSGNTDSNRDNLRADSVNAFAKYMADVIEYWNNNGILFKSTDPMNEPYTNYWGANSNKQEGCHFDQGESQSRILVALNRELEAKGLGNILISATDETSIDTAITSYNKLSDEAKAVVDRIDTHTYGGSNRAGLNELAENENKNLWMSEVDGGYTAGTNAGEMSAALGLAQQMMKDVNGLESTAWILWNAIDMHSDSSEYGQSWVNKGSQNDFTSMDALYNAVNLNSGYWGFAYADHDTGNIELTKKYYGFGQLSKYIRPGYTIIGSNKGSVLSAYDSEGKRAVIVALNTSDADKNYKFDLSGFTTMGSNIQAIRTSGSLAEGENWADVTAIDNIVPDTEGRTFTATMKANSITTYIVDGVEGIEPEKEKPAIALKQIPVEKSQVTGSAPWNNGTKDVASQVVDNNYDTFFDGVLEGYVTIDLQEEKQIAAIGYAPRNGFADRCVDATIYGSNDGENWTALYTIDSVPAEKQDTIVYYSEFNTTERNFRYIKYAQTPNGNCNLSELKIYEQEKAVIANLQAHYDMSHEGNVLKDISGKGNDITLYDTTDSDFASYGEEEVMQFNKKQYAELPLGITGADGSFTVSATFSAQNTSDAWLWCFGNKVDNWPNVKNYIFVGPKSNQNGYKNKAIAAVHNGSSETRLPAPANETISAGYTTITLVSEGFSTNKVSLYIDGVKAAENTCSDLIEAIPTEGILGYIGKSLYAPDPLLTANVADFKVWNAALSDAEVVEATPSSEEKEKMLLADIVKATLKENKAANKIESDITFPAKVDGIDLTWNVPENAVIAADGKVTLPAEDTTVDVSVTYGDNITKVISFTALGENIESTLQKAYDGLDILNKDDVRGNITLPSKTESGVEITWTTSHPDIVDLAEHANEGYDAMPAGKVTRPAQDTKVTMTAVLSYKGTTKEKQIELNVKAAPQKIEESDYTDYFFAYFAGEGYADGEQIYFASSEDGLNWADLNENKPVLTSTLGEKGVRDPFIIRSPEGDKFYMIATDLKINGGNGWDAAQNSGSQSLMVWESSDLVNWSDQRMVEVSAKIGAGCTWAPEATYDALTGEYVVYWASRTPAVDEKQRVYYAKTRDFYTFTEPKLYIEKDESSIDTTIIENNGTYYRYTKNEGGSTNEMGAITKSIFVEKSDKLLGTYTQIASADLNSKDNQYVEGPTIFKLNEDDATDKAKYCLLVDDFGGGGYYPLVTDDLESGAFTKLEKDTYKMPSRARHGTPIRITEAEYKAITAAYATPETVNSATYAGVAPTDLPKSVKVGKEQKNVTWNLDGVDFAKEAFSYVTVEGDVEGSSKKATAKVQIIPKNIEYMIDCANEGSNTWANTVKLNDKLFNANAVDQEKTAENTWGRTSKLDTDVAVYSGSSLTNPYAGGYWAKGGKNISYDLSLTAGKHEIMLGCQGWWNMNRAMDVYYSVDGGEEVKLCDFDAKKSESVLASGKIELEKDAIVTVTVKKAANDDPILSFLAVSEEEKAVVAKKDIAKMEISSVKGATYTGSEITREITIKDGEKVLEENVDYTLSYENNVNVGKAVITITGIGDYEGEKEVRFNVVAKALTASNIVFDKIEKQTYTRKPITPAVTVKYNNMTLKENEDYTVEYVRNTGIGVASIKVTGKGNYRSTKTLKFTILPKQVKGVKAKSEGYNRVKISWSEYHGISGYKVYRSTDRVHFNCIAVLEDSDITSYVDRKAVCGKQYYYRVRSYKERTSNVYYGAMSNIVDGMANLAKPTLLLAANASEQAVTINWERVSGANGYEVYQTDKKVNGKAEGYSQVATIENAGTLTYTASNLNAKKTYYYKIRAYRVVDGEKVYSNYSNVKGAYVKK